MDETTLLRIEHKRLASMAGDLAAMASQPEPAEPIRLFELRREFGRMLVAHLAREDWVIYPRLSTDARPEVRALATRLAAEALAFSAAFSKYSRQWSTVAIAADWPGFGEATLEILAQFQRRVATEDRDLYPLVEDDAYAFPERSVA